MILNFKIKQKKKLTQKKSQIKFENQDSYSAYVAARTAEEKKGENILLLDVSRLTIITDYFLIVTAKSTAQINAISKHLEETLGKLNQILISKEGFLMSNWVVLDFGNLVVHIMGEKERNYYKLERFWSNATLIDNKLWEKAS